MNIKIYNSDLPSDLNLFDEKEVALDCEALGLVLGRDPLTLVQIGLKNNNYHLVKLDRDNYNAPNLKKFLSNSEATFIMHYARQDMLWLKYHLDVNLKNIFCSKLSSKLVRTASQFHGYKDLVKEFCGKDISKKEQQSDWGGNLSEKQIKYAAQDTQYLFEIKEKLNELLNREKRKNLFDSSMKVIPILVDMEIAGFKLSTFEH